MAPLITVHSLQMVVPTHMVLQFTDLLDNAFALRDLGLNIGQICRFRGLLDLKRQVVVYSTEPVYNACNDYGPSFHDSFVSSMFNNVRHEVADDPTHEKL